MRIFTLILLILAVIAADQVSKWAILEFYLRQDGASLSFLDWLQNHDRLPFHMIPVIPHFNLVMVWNEGVSFGLFNELASGSTILSLISIIVSIGLFLWMISAQSYFNSLCLALIIGGAIGNVIDRVRFGAVADFIDIYWQSYHFPAFNLADSCITIGVALLLIHGIFFEKEDKT